MTSWKQEGRNWRLDCLQGPKYHTWRHFLFSLLILESIRIIIFHYDLWVDTHKCCTTVCWQKDKRESMRNLAWFGRDPRPLTRQLRSPCAHWASIIPTVPSSLAQNSKSMHYIGWRSSENKWFEGWKGGVPVLDIRVRIFVWCFPIWFTEILHNSALASGHHNKYRQKICLASDKDPTHDLWLDDCNHPAPVWTAIIFFIQVLLLILLKHVYLRNLLSQRL